MNRKNKFILRNILILSFIGIFGINFYIGLNPLIKEPNNIREISLKSSSTYTGSGTILNGGRHIRYIGIIQSYSNISISFIYDFSTDLRFIIVNYDGLMEYQSGTTTFSNGVIFYGTGTGYSEVVSYYGFFNSDDYYLIFEDYDSSTSSHIISYIIITTEFDNPFTISPNLLITIITLIVIFTPVIIGIIVFLKRRNVKTDEVKQTDSPQLQESQIIFCPYCGDKSIIDAIFCPTCGSKL